MHKLVRAYYTTLEQLDHHRVTRETAVRQPFLDLLRAAAGPRGLTVEAEFPMQGVRGHRIIVDAALRDDAVEEMLIQHLLTERLFRTVFKNPDFVRRNAIAHQIETVLDTLFARHYSREEYLGTLDWFYRAIEGPADTSAGFLKSNGSDVRRFRPKDPCIDPEYMEILEAKCC